MTNAYQELSAYSSWVSWRNEVVNGSQTKVPYNPTTGSRADSSDPQTWTTSAHAYNGTAHHYSGAGFVLSDTDPFTCIDLDNPFVRKLNGQVYQITAENDPAAYAEACEVWASYDSIIRDFDSYTEWSPSGSGFHIWIKGKLPADWGKRRGTFEVYSRLRFMTITGRSYHAEPKPINERQGALELFAMKLGLEPGNLAHVESRPETQSDIDLYTRIANSGCGADFQALFAMDSTTYTGDKSARDLALANYIGAFTDNLEQCERLFKFSNWYQSREKLIARPDLVSRVVRLSFDRKPPPIDISEVLRKVAEVRQQWQTPAFDTAPSDAAPINLPQVFDNKLNELPPGLIGMLAEFFYWSSPRPTVECSLAGAIAFMAGIAGRAFNVSGTGLNQYVVIIGKSGIGKDTVNTGMQRLIASVQMSHPAASGFIGPAGIQSAQGLFKSFTSGAGQMPSLSFVSPIGEFGVWLKTLSDPRANSVQRDLQRAILELWGRSGRGNSTGGLKYSDSGKDVPAIQAPAFSIIGDTVPSRFYEALTREVIEGGLLPRLLLIEHKGQRPDDNKLAHKRYPSDELLQWLKAFMEVCLTQNQQNDPKDVAFTSEAEMMLDDFNKEIDTIIRQHWDDEVYSAVYNRTHLKALKLAALRAVGNQWHKPCIDANDAAWAISLARADAHMVLNRLHAGEVSTGNQVDDKHKAIKTTLRYYLAKGTSSLTKTQKCYANESAFKAGCFPGAVVRGYTMKLGPFKKRTGFDESRAYEQTLKELEQDGVIRLIRNDPADQELLRSFGVPSSKSLWVLVVNPGALETA